MSIQLSVVVPAFNEEKLLPTTLACIADCLTALDVSSEVIVVDNNSTDNTAKIAQENDAKLVFEPVNNIARARNAGAKSAQGKYILFVDADCEPSPELFKKAFDLVDQGDVVLCGAQSFMEGLSGISKKMIDISNRTLAKRKWVLGSFALCTREIYELAGGFDEKYYTSEDIYFSIKVRDLIKGQNKSIHVIENPRITTSARKFESPFRMIVMLFVSLIPNSNRYKSLMGYWYNRSD